MGKSSRRKSRSQPPPAPAPAPGRHVGVYTFTAYRLFVGCLLIFGFGFAAGVLAARVLLPTAPTLPSAFSGPAGRSPAPSAPAARSPSLVLPSFEKLQEVESLRKHLEHEPGDLDSRIRLGHALFDIGNYSEAIGHYERFLEARPHDADVRTDLGIAYRRTGRSDLAAQAFRRAIQDVSGHLNAHYNLGVVLAHDLDDPAGAIAAWERYLELAPEASNRDDVRQGIRQLQSRLSR